MTFFPGAVRLCHLYPDTLDSVHLLFCIPMAVDWGDSSLTAVLWGLQPSSVVTFSVMPSLIPLPSRHAPKHVARAHLYHSTHCVALPLCSRALSPSPAESFLRKSPCHPDLSVPGTNIGLHSSCLINVLKSK